MKRKIYVVFTILGIVLFVSSCSKKILPLGEKYFTVSPNPLEVKGEKVEAEINGVIPQKYFRKDAILTITPILKYHNKSLGAKALVFQGEDVVDNYLGMYMQAIVGNLQDTAGNVNAVLKQTQVLNMLNAKYLIYNPNSFPLLNANAFGNAWFIDNFKLVDNPDAEIEALGTENLQRTAIINKNKFDVSKLPTLSYSNDSSKQVILTNYEPDKLEFDVNTSTEDFVVFSDIYYPKGWTAYVDDNPTQIYQTNYILRGIVIPAGKHKIKFEFKPASLFVANKIALVGSILVILIIIGSFYMLYKELKLND